MATELPPIYVPEQPQPISLAAPGEDQDQISLAPEDGAPTSQPSVPLAQERTFKTNLGLGKVLNKTSADIYKDIQLGREQGLREQAAATLDHQTYQQKQQAVIDFANKKGGPLTREEMDYVLNSFKSATPNSVIEQNYATKYVDSLQDAADVVKSSWYTRAGLEIPKQVEVAKAKAADITSRMEFFKTQLKNADEEVSHQDWIPYLADLGKTMFQPYVEYKMRGNNPAVGTLSGGLLLGSNLKAQADRLYEIPFEQAKEEFLKTFNYLKKDNPILAKRFAEYAVGKSTDDKMLDNIFTVFTPFDYKALAAGGVNLLRKGTLFNQTNRAFKEAVKAAAEMDPPTASHIAEAAGDLKTAAEIKTVENADTGVKLSPMDTLMSNFRLDREKIKDNPGSLSREQILRLENQDYAAEASLRNKYETSGRVRRAVTPMSDPEYVAKLNQDAREYYKGMDNAILDISDPHWDNLTNTHYHEISFGNMDGNLFSNPETAKNFVEMDGKFKNVKIMDAIGDVEREPATIAGNKRDLQRRAQIPDSIDAAQKALDKISAEVKALPKPAKDAAPAVRQEYKARLDAIKVDRDFFRDTIKKYTEELKAINERVTIIPARIEQQGVGYKFVVSRNLNETSNVYRDLMLGPEGNRDLNALSTSSATGVTALRQAALGWITGADNTLSRYESMQRKVATYGQNRFKEWVDEQGKYINQVQTGVIKRDPVTGEKIAWARPKAWVGQINNREISRQFNEVLNFAKSDINPITNEIGYFKQTPGELENHYITYFKRPPSMAEHEAYRAYVRALEGERTFYEIAEYRNRARLGAEQHTIITMKDGQRVASEAFDGMQQKVWPGGKDQILVMGDKLGSEKIYNLDHMAKPVKDEYIKNMESGSAKVIRIYNPDTFPMRGFSDIAGNERIRYIYTATSESEPLAFNHVNRRGGGHFEYDYDNYIKSARVIPQQGGAAGSDKRKAFQHDYVGDVTVMPISNRAMGRDVIKRMDVVRQAIDKGDWVAAEDLARNLPMEWDEFSKWYKPGRDKNGRATPPMLDSAEPFYIVPKNKTIGDLDKSLRDRYPSTFNNATKSGSDAAQFKVAWNQERDAIGLYTVDDVGELGRPMYNWRPADMVDPIPTMNRSLQRAVSSVFMDDYKFYAVEHWLREAEPHLKADNGEIRSSPFWHFENAPFDFSPGTPKEVQWNLQSNRFKIKQFIGTPDKFDTWIDNLSQELLDRAYTRYGPEGSRSVVDKVKVIPIRMLSSVSDPIDYLRSMAFNFKLGLYAVPQFIVQAQSHSLIWGIEPRHGTVGTYHTLLHTWARFTENPEILKAIDEYATKLNGFGSKARPGEWMEARKEFQNSGFEHVGGEYAMMDDVAKPDFVGNEFGSFMKAGQIFFREGERASRTTAYYTAFRKFRDENPTAVIGNAERQQILEYADMLNNNMSRASASVLHGGVFSLTSQFLSYQLRLGELFWGKRLGETLAERNLARARILAVYGGLYGVPTAFGVSGFPLGDSIRQEAIDRGYVIGDNWVTSLVMEGIPSWTIAMATGKGDLTKGEFYNIGNRYGAQGFTQIREAMRSDATIWKLLGGASGSIAMNTFGSMDSFTRAAMSYFNTSDQAVYPLVANDFVDLFKEISSVNQAWKVYAALNTGHWLNKQESTVTDVSALSAIFMGFTGLSPQKQDDAFAKGQIKKGEDAYQKYLMKEFTEEHRRGIQATVDKNYEQASKFFTRARAILEIGGFPIDRRAEALAAANKSMEAIIDRGDYDFALKNVPTKKWFQGNVPQTRLEQYQKELRQKANP